MRRPRERSKRFLWAWALPALLGGLLNTGGCATFAVEFTGRVTAVPDGCTLSFVHDSALDRVRLYGIQCPSLNEPFGPEAKETTETLALGKTVTLKAWGLDKVGRTVGIVVLPNGTVVNHELVKAGLAQWDQRYPDETLRKLDTHARAARRGIWSDEGR